MGCLAKLWVGKRQHRKYDHNWIKKGKITILCQKGFPLNFLSLSIISKKFLTIRPLVLSGLSTFLELLQARLWVGGQENWSSRNFSSYINPTAIRGGGVDYAHHISLSLPIFESHKRACTYVPSNRKMSVLKVFSLAFKFAYFYVATCNFTIPQFQQN